MTTRRVFIRQLSVLGGLAISALPARLHGNDEDSSNPAVLKYLNRIYHPERRRHAFRPENSGEFEAWQIRARAELRRLLGLDRKPALNHDNPASVTLGEPVQRTGYSQRRGMITTEPGVSLPFWLLQPPGSGPFPLAVLPHGHNRYGYDNYAGIYRDEKSRQQSLAVDGNVAVQAVRNGFLAIAPATRGLSAGGVPDQFGRHGNRDCRSHLIHCLLAGRSPMGERVWDMERIIDWALQLPQVDSGRKILMMGNSGGGMVTLYAAACDQRVKIAVTSCCFTTLVSPAGRVYHCDCNLVPGILEFGELADVAGLIAPRHLLVVNGRQDKLHSVTDIGRATQALQRIYDASGHDSRFQHHLAEGGHRFYASLMWPFVMAAVGA